MMSFECENPRVLSEVMRVAATVLEEGTLTIEDEKIIVQGVDSAKVIYINNVLYSTFFIDPQYTRRCEIGYDFEDIYTSMKLCASADSITLQIDDHDRLIIEAESEVTRRFTHTPIEYSYVQKKPLDVSYDAYIEIPYTELHRILKESMTRDRFITIHADEDKATFTSQNPDAEYIAEYIHACIFPEEASATYTTQNILKALPRISEIVELGFQDNGVLHIRLRGEGLESEAYVAPIIDQDD